MTNTISSVDPDGLLEYSVVFTDRSLNHMSAKFQQVMRDIHAEMCDVYRASTMAIIPGGGSFGLEAVARQFATDKKCLIVRNGWFSYRWTQIFEAGDIPSSATVIKAERTAQTHQAPFRPAPIETVTQRIREEKPEMVFAAHVETSAGIILPDDYIAAVAEAAHEVGALFVLDCVASGCLWVDMQATGVDVLVTAPQKGWSSSPSAGLVMLSERATTHMANTKSSSFVVDLAKWHSIMKAYLDGGHAYHSTMPTDALAGFRDNVMETKSYGYEQIKQDQVTLGQRCRDVLAKHGYPSVAAEGFEAPSVIVSYTDDADEATGKRFAAAGMQVAAGVPLEVGEPSDYRAFRVGLFGLDKLGNIDRTVQLLDDTLTALSATREAAE